MNSPEADALGPNLTNDSELQSASKATSETLEDYTLRFAPRHYRQWTPAVVATSALGGIAYLADFAIGATIGISFGTTNAVLGIIAAAVLIFCTEFPLAYYAARYNTDLHLITRGSGFDYYGSVIANVIFASFTFIFFRLGRLDYGSGLGNRARYSAVVGLPNFHCYGNSVSYLWHEGTR
ncbi:hypothetical protein [Halioxenophilus aromaticivorans]|uniref:Uncharacterized protein n=1 Tax=Halioxenophilus aromaticivorans TaxID=1306992 RepID=A0AAV3U9Z9_9ALTE